VRESRRGEESLEPREWRGPKVTRDERPHATHLTHPSHASHHLWWNWNWPWWRHRTTTSPSSSSLTSGSIFPVVTSPSLPRERWSCLLSLVQFRQAFLLAELVGHLLLLKPHFCHHRLGLLNSRVLAICLLLNQLVSIGPFHVPVKVASSAAAPSATTTLIKPTTTSSSLRLGLPGVGRRPSSPPVALLRSRICLPRPPAAPSPSLEVTSPLSWPGIVSRRRQ